MKRIQYHNGDHFYSLPQSVEMEGFELTYSCEDFEPIECGGQLLGPSGKLFSPGWPNQYPNYAYCFWGIECDQDETVEIAFKNFDVNSDSNCQ